MNWGHSDEKSFEVLIERFSGYIRAQIQKFEPQRSGIDPDDLTQEIRIKLWKVLKNEKKILNYSSYIKKIVDSTVIDHIRKSRRQEFALNIEKLKFISEQKSNYAMCFSDEKMHAQLIAQAINSLMKSRQKVVRLFLLNMTLDEISIFLNWSKDKTRNLLYRGLTDLKNALKDVGIDYENR